MLDSRLNLLSGHSASFSNEFRVFVRLFRVEIGRHLLEELIVVERLKTAASLSSRGYHQLCDQFRFPNAFPPTVIMPI
jgi:hypothetical protein